MEEKRNEVMVESKKKRNMNFVAWQSWCKDTIWPPGSAAKAQFTQRQKIRSVNIFIKFVDNVFLC